jgi:secondary thiamine-phosphate synthase enzyme
MQTLTVNSRDRTDFIDITRQVRDAVQSAGMERGVVTVFIPHTTAGITINENADPDVGRESTSASSTAPAAARSGSPLHSFSAAKAAA